MHGCYGSQIDIKLPTVQWRNMAGWVGIPYVLMVCLEDAVNLYVYISYSNYSHKWCRTHYAWHNSWANHDDQTAEYPPCLVQSSNHQFGNGILTYMKTIKMKKSCIVEQAAFIKYPTVSRIIFQFSFNLTDTLQGTNISPKNGIFEDDVPFPQVGYVNFPEGN